MSLLIHIRYIGEKNNARNFAKEMLDNNIVNKIRNQKGNIQYDYYIPFKDDGSILLIDRWENQEALDIHHKSSMMEEIIGLREKYDLRMVVERFESIEDNPNDIKYIRE